MAQKIYGGRNEIGISFSTETCVQKMNIYGLYKEKNARKLSQLMKTVTNVIAEIQEKLTTCFHSICMQQCNSTNFCQVQYEQEVQLKSGSMT